MACEGILAGSTTAFLGVSEAPGCICPEAWYLPKGLGRPAEGSNYKSGLGFLADFWPLGAHGGPREPRERPRLENKCRLHEQLAPETKSNSHSWALCVFGTESKNTKR
jgi:hypothetical protein